MCFKSVDLNGVDYCAGDDWYDESNWPEAAVVGLVVVEFGAFEYSMGLDCVGNFLYATNVHHHQQTVVNCTHFVSIDFLVDHVNSKWFWLKENQTS